MNSPGLPGQCTLFLRAPHPGTCYRGRAGESLVAKVWLLDDGETSEMLCANDCTTRHGETESEKRVDPALCTAISLSQDMLGCMDRSQIYSTSHGMMGDPSVVSGKIRVVGIGHLSRVLMQVQNLRAPDAHAYATPELGAPCPQCPHKQIPCRKGRRERGPAEQSLV